MNCAICNLEHFGACIPALKREVARLNALLADVSQPIVSHLSTVNYVSRANGKKRDRRAYQREYMRKKRAEATK